MRLRWCAISWLATVPAASAGATPTVGSVDCDVAIVNATLIDGNGGPPARNATVLVRQGRIQAVGSSSLASGAQCGQTIDATGKYLIPGFVDTNVHVSLGGNMESNIRYRDQRFDIALEGAQLHLKYGVTTIRDSYGIMKPLLAVRDAIARGEVIGPRLYVAGNIVGWGGFFAATFGPPLPANLFQEQLNDEITEGSGEELIEMGPDSLRAAMNRYLDKGVDFIKYGGTVHMAFPTTLVFSPRQAKVIVDAAHRRGKVAETHATSPEGLLIALEAGVDLVQHPEALDVPLTDELVRLLVDRKVICSMNVNSQTGKSWRDYLAQQAKAEADAKRAGQDTSRGTRTWPAHPKTAHQIFEATVRPFLPKVERANAERLVRDGCLISVATDNDLGSAPEFIKDPGEWRAREPGAGTMLSIEGLVELGMTPMQALVAATKHGAMASKALAEYGTIESGKAADLLLIDASPLDDIRNIRRLDMVMKGGAVIDFRKLPTKPIYSRAPGAAGARN